ncbi:hypothetical protein C7A07_00045 [Pseudomonas fragi]|nr:hypothetical protein CJU78_14555 [Pseudomonas fragi]PRX00231.1 hypothetical protein C7A07_00045 [Pseudomonas fragi]
MQAPLGSAIVAAKPALTPTLSRRARGLAESILGSAQYFQIAEILKFPPISPLSLRERARVRGAF